MWWVPILAWAIAVAVALVVLGFCGYEVAWKAARLRRDMARLQSLNGELIDLRTELQATQQRATRAFAR